MGKKGPVFKNKNKKNRHGTNCNDSSRVIVGRSPNDPIPYSFTVQKSVEHYIVKYDLKCSLLQFPSRAPWNKILSKNKVSNEFLDVFSNRINWSFACRYQKLSESLMNKYSDKLDWSIVSICQDMSKKFIFKHLKDLDMNIIINDRFLISQKDIDKYEEKQKQKEKRIFMEGGEEIENRFDILDL